jgi:hypothetical protein
VEKKLQALRREADEIARIIGAIIVHAKNNKCPKIIFAARGKTRPVTLPFYFYPVSNKCSFFILPFYFLSLP